MVVLESRNGSWRRAGNLQFELELESVYSVIWLDYGRVVGIGADLAHAATNSHAQRWIYSKHRSSFNSTMFAVSPSASVYYSKPAEISLNSADRQWVLVSIASEC